MIKTHWEIVEEILEEQKKNKGVVAVTLFGSMARGEENPDSDIDILIISRNAKKWNLINKKKYNIKIDFEVCPLENLNQQIKEYPFLSYDYLKQKILYDPEGIMKRLKRDLEKYFKDHKEIVEFWENKLEIMRENKAKGQDPKDAVKSYDEAELLFSKEHKITRNFFSG